MLLQNIVLITLLFADTLFSGFPATTVIKTPAGYTTIQHLQIGDLVGCFDIQQNKVVYKKILGIKSCHETNCYCIVIENEKIVVAADHEFYLPTKKIWQQAKELTAGDILLKRCNELIPIQEVFQIQDGIDLFDLSIQDCHNFCVATNEVLVHNFLPIVVGVTFVFGGGAIEFAVISAAIVTAGGIIGLNLRKKQTNSPTLQAQELSQNLGNSTQYYLQSGTYEVVINNESPSQESYSYKSKPKSSKNISIPVSNNNCASPSPEDPEEFKKKHPFGKYADASYHHQNSSGLKSPAPKNGQTALDNSVPIKDTAARRVGVSEGEIVILDRTCEGLYHGHVRTWQELCKDPRGVRIKNALENHKLVDKFGRILQ